MFPDLKVGLERLAPAVCLASTSHVHMKRNEKSAVCSVTLASQECGAPALCDQDPSIHIVCNSYLCFPVAVHNWAGH